MKRIIDIGWMTFRRLVRSRVLVVFLVVVALILATYSTLVVKMIAAAKAGDREVVSATFPTLLYFAITWFSIISSVMGTIIGVTAIRQEITDGTIYGILSKPVARGEYVAGNVVGASALLVFVWIVFSLVLSVLAALLGAPLGLHYYAALAGEFLKTGISLTAALLCSTRFNPWIAAALTLLIVNGVEAMQGVTGILRAAGLLLPDQVVDVLCFPFPRMTALDGLMSRMSQSDLASGPVFPGVIHFIDYSLVMVVLAYLSFRRLDLNRTSD